MEEFRFHPFRVRYPYDSPVDRMRARLLLSVGFIILVVSVLALSVMLTRTTQYFDRLLAIMTPIWIVTGINVYLIQTGRLHVASILFLTVFLAAVGVNLYGYGVGATTLLPIALGVTIATALLGMRAGIVVLIGGGVMTVVAMYAQENGIIINAYEPVGEVVYSLAELLVMTLILAMSTRALENALLHATRTASNLSATAQVSTSIVSTQSLDALLRESVALVREKFGFYSVQVFLVTQDNTSAVLRAGTGRAGRRLVAQGYRFEVSSRTAVGRAILINEPVLISEMDALFVPHPLLPDARAELAVPLRTSDRVIGALDVQSTRADTFAPEDIASLQALANQLAAGVENALSLEAVRQELAEKQQALDGLQVRLQEAERANRQLTGQVWARYLSGRGADTLGFDWEGDQVEAQTGWTSGMVATTSHGRISLRQENDRQVLTVPITVRGRALGAVELVNTPDRRWDEASVELAQEVVGRLAISLETARLTEDAHRLAERERLVGQVSRDLQGKQDLAEVLSLASAEFHRALGATVTTVRLGGFEPEPVDRR